MFVGAKVVSHGRYVALQIAEVAIPRQMFQKDFAADSGTTAAAANNAGMRLPMEACVKCHGKWPNRR